MTELASQIGTLIVLIDDASSIEEAAENLIFGGMHFQ